MNTWDVFVSYRWIEPDQTWVRTELVPALRASGLCVFLDVAEDGFVPGRDAICEMTRAGHESRRTLSVWTPDYFAEDRAVWFEALQARRRDPQGRQSALVPLLLRGAQVPGEFYGLVPVNWTDEARRPTEWVRLLSVLGADRHDITPPRACPSTRTDQKSITSIAPEAACRGVVTSLAARLATRDPVERYWLYIALGWTGGMETQHLLESAADREADPFARRGIEDAFELLAGARELR
jgi:hypothetical protein